MRRLLTLFVVVVVAAGLAVPATGATGGDSRPERIASGLAQRASAAQERTGEMALVRVQAAGSAASASGLIVELGGRIISQEGAALVASIPLGRLLDLSGDDRVAFVSSLPEPITEAVSQGVVGHDAAAWHAAGLDGDGVRVMIVDTGFSSYGEALATGDVPSPGGEARGPSCRGGVYSGGSHGTTVTEIVHDMAPGATLYLYRSCNVADGHDIGQVAAEFEIDVVTQSLGYFNTGPLDGSDPWGFWDFVTYLRSLDAVWINSAGNYREGHWRGTWEGDDILEFAGTPFLPVDVSPGDNIYLRWDDWRLPVGQGCPECGSNVDLDLYLLDANQDIVASSTTVQSFVAPAAPIEELSVPAGGPFTIQVRAAVSGHLVPPDMAIDIFVPNRQVAPALQVHDGSLNDPSTLPLAIAVGAVCHVDSQARYYSSEGPTADGRVKPDITTFDGVSTQTAGPSSSCFDGFRGTSASAPHIAGAAALLIQASGVPADEIAAMLTRLTQDRGAPGPDNRYGAGVLELGTPPAGSCEGHAATIVALPGQVVVQGTDGDDVIVGNELANRILAGPGNDIVCGGGGRDRIYGGDGADEISAGPGRDRIFGGAGDDIGRGQGNHDRLLGGDGNDTLLGGNGLDTLDGMAGVNTLDGGDGDDACANGATVISCESIV